MSMTGIESPAAADEQTRARYPDRTGFVERDGVRVFWEEYGSGEPVILFIHGWSITPSRVWRAQLPFFARHARVLTFDGRGNGRSDRPLDAAAHTHSQTAADAIAVLDAAGVERAHLVGWSLGADRAMLVAAEHPERVESVCLVGPGVGPTDVLPRPALEGPHFDDEREVYEGWAKFNQRYWQRDLRGFAEFFLAECLPEPHSTKQIEDGVGWTLGTSADVLAATFAAAAEPIPPELWNRLRCPVMVVSGTDDRITLFPNAEALAEATGARFLVFEDGGHSAPARHPVHFNLEVRDFILGGTPRRRFRRSVDRPHRALFVSSPIGLGHAWRDVAIARELRRLDPDLHIDWLAQAPVTHVLEAEGERIHPDSALLASEAVHIDSEVRGHELNAFQAFRRMDEILVANFMVFEDLVEQEPYDLWIGDEAWEIDHFLHHNPECKRAPYVWLSDFVGFLPMPEGGEREAFLTADYNAEMLEHIERFPWVRDRSIFIGNPEDIVPDDFGPGLPNIRAWAMEHFDFTGHIPGFDGASAEAGRDALRAQLGYGAGETICVVSAGGSAAGEHLLREAIAAHPIAAARIPGLRTVVVAGPQIATDSLGQADGVEVVGYVHDLRRRLAACDIAISHGGLATTMELTATRRPFLYFPLTRHFEQQRHVRHRLERYRAGRRMDLGASPPQVIADAIVEELARPVDCLPVETDGARRAAALIAPLLGARRV
jgi:pimeloyl-ACP methyl ester carboxylesterase/predicted glycosyltransferase